MKATAAEAKAVFSFPYNFSFLASSQPASRQRPRWPRLCFLKLHQKDKEKEKLTSSKKELESSNSKAK